MRQGWGRGLSNVTDVKRPSAHTPTCASIVKSICRLNLSSANNAKNVSPERKPCMYMYRKVIMKTELSHVTFAESLSGEAVMYVDTSWNTSLLSRTVAVNDGPSKYQSIKEHVIYFYWWKPTHAASPQITYFLFHSNNRYSCWSLYSLAPPPLVSTTSSAASPFSIYIPIK